MTNFRKEAQAPLSNQHLETGLLYKIWAQIDFKVTEVYFFPFEEWSLRSALWKVDKIQIESACLNVYGRFSSHFSILLPFVPFWFVWSDRDFKQNIARNAKTVLYHQPSASRTSQRLSFISHPSSHSSLSCFPYFWYLFLGPGGYLCIGWFRWL